MLASFLPYSSCSPLRRNSQQVDDVRNKVHDADKTVSSKMSEAQVQFDKLKNDTASQFDKSKDDTKKEFNQSVDKFDKTVERKASEAKSGISSWFGFGK